MYYLLNIINGSSTNREWNNL